MHGEQAVCVLGEVHPATREKFDMPARAYIAEMDMAVLAELRRPMGDVKPMPRYPAVSRDLALSGDSPALVLRRLREWVREEARVYLGGLLDSLAREHGFSYASLSIRFQRGRWGSCSARGGISLNACLLFLPERLARHILLHELCHTRQLNHSRAFWKQLFAVDPNALAHDKAIRHAWRHVPAWIFTDQERSVPD